MDLKKIRVRQDLERMVTNYFLMGEIGEKETGEIIDFIDRAIGGGAPPKPCVERKIIIFPTAYAGRRPEAPPEKARDYKKPAVIEAPYGVPLPEGRPDFREALQRDGLVLVKWEKRVSGKGAFYSVQWAKSRGENRRKYWSRSMPEDEVPYAAPCGCSRGFSYSHNYGDPCEYTVEVAPGDVMNGPFSEYHKYVQGLKSLGLKADFDHDFDLTTETRNRFLEKNKELLGLGIPSRALNALNYMGVFTVRELEKVTVEKLRSAKGFGDKTIQEFLGALEKKNIFLRKESFA